MHLLLQCRMEKEFLLNSPNNSLNLQNTESTYIIARLHRTKYMLHRHYNINYWAKNTSHFYNNVITLHR